MGDFGGKWDEEFSTVGDKGEIGFLDFGDDQSVCSYNPDQEGSVVISVPFPMSGGNPQSIVVGETAAESITIKNTTSEPVTLWSVSIFASTPENSFKLSLMKPPSGNETSRGYIDFFTLEDRMIQPRETLTVWISCKPKAIDLHTSVMYFDVENTRIERVVFLMCDGNISQSLASRRPYSRDRREKQSVTDGTFVMGVRPPKKTDKVFKN